MAMTTTAATTNTPGSLTTMDTENEALEETDADCKTATLLICLFILFVCETDLKNMKLPIKSIKQELIVVNG